MYILDSIKKRAGVLAITTVVILALGGLIFGPTLVFGDTPLTDPRVSSTNFLYSWGPDSFGTTVRQGLYSLRNALLLPISVNQHGFYLLSFILPLVLIAPTYYWLLTKMGISNKFVKVLSSSFALINPVVIGDFSKAQSFWIYITLPWILYFLLKIFYKRQFSLSNFVNLSLFTFLTFGLLPPIILPIVMVYGVMLVVLFILQDKQSFTTYKSLVSIGLKSILAGGLFLIMALPYVLIAPAGQAAFKPVSLLADYFHNYAYMTLDNTFRLAGNEGNGMSILEYNHFSLTNVFGLFFFGVIVYGFIDTRIKKNTLNLTLFITLLSIFGFLHLLATNSDFGVAVFQSQFIASTIRDPTKIFEVLLPVFIVSFAFSITSIVTVVGKKARYLLYAVTALSIAIYGWPVFTGNLGILANRDEKISAYKADTTVADIVNDEKDNDKRAIIVPSGHREELNYQSTSKSLNTLRVGGALPRTLGLIEELQNSIDAKSNYTAGILRVSGINTVYVKSNNADYFKRIFGLLNGVDSSATLTNDHFNKLLGAPQVNPRYSKYTNKKSDEVVSSPVDLANVNENVSIHEILPLIMDSKTIIQKTDKVSTAQADNYISKKRLSAGEKISYGKAQLYTNEIVELQYKLVKNTHSAELQISQIDPIGRAPTELLNQVVDSNSTQLIIDGEPYDLSTTSAKVAIKPGDHTIGTGVQEPLSIEAQDPSFETNKHVGDVTKLRKGLSGIYSKFSNDSIDGSRSLLVGSNNHNALISKKFLAEKLTLYRVEVNYKYLQGNAPSLGLFNSENLLGDRTIELSSGDHKWQSAKTYVNYLDKQTQIDVNLYVNPTSKVKSESLFDNLKIYKLRITNIATLPIDKYQSDYTLNDYVNTTSKASEKNLIKNGSFEDGSYLGSSGDATISSPGTPNFTVKRSLDSTQGRASLELKSNNHTVYVRKQMNNFSPNKVYKVSLDYKHIKGARPAVTLWQDGINEALDYKTLPSNSEWQTYEYTFVPKAGATNISVYLYSASSGKETINRFDNVAISEQPLIKNYLMLSQNAKAPNTSIVDNFKQINPTKYDVSMKKGNGLVKLNVSYHQGWRAYYVPLDYKEQSLISYLTFKPPGARVADNSHVVVDGYVNGWTIANQEIPINLAQTGNYRLIVEYWPERQYMLALLGSILTLLGVCTYLVTTRFKHSSKFKRSKAYTLYPKSENRKNKLLNEQTLRTPTSVAKNKQYSLAQQKNGVHKDKR